MKLSRRNLLKWGGAAVLGASGVGALAHFYKRYPQILEAKTLGGIPVQYCAGKGNPIVFLGEIHPEPFLQLATPIQSKNTPNIDEVTRTAWDAYDNYGIRALFVEGVTPEWIAEYKRTGHIFANQKLPQEYKTKLEKLMGERDWNFYGDSTEAARYAHSCVGPVSDVYGQRLRQLQEAMFREQDVITSDPSLPSQQASLARLRELRDNLQLGIDEVYFPKRDLIQYAVTIVREEALITEAKNALRQEKGLVVVYGASHAHRLKETTQQQGLALMIVMSNQLYESSSKPRPYALGDAFILPNPVVEPRKK